MKNKNILVTFDYELFLGKISGTAHNCIIEPTNYLLPVLKKHAIKAIFFIDVTHLLKLQEYASNYPACADDLDAITKQIQNISNDGHYVYLHVHPHWLDAVYLPEINQWNLSNYSRFAIETLDVNTRNKLLKDCHNMLLSILNNKGPIEGYRAGGLFIQPLANFIEFFDRHQIKYEFSVYPNFESATDKFKVSFKNVPNKSCYHFSDDECVENLDGRFTEYTLSEFKMQGINRIINSIYFRLANKIGNTKMFGDGMGAMHILQNNEVKVGVNGEVKETFSVELMNNWKNSLYLTYLQTNDYLHFLSHPKLVSVASIKALDKFFSRATKKYNITTDFKAFKID